MAALLNNRCAPFRCLALLLPGPACRSAQPLLPLPLLGPACRFAELLSC